MPDILLFDIFEPQSGDGVSTGTVYPSRVSLWLCTGNTCFEKETHKNPTPAISDIYFYFFNSILLMRFIVYLLMIYQAFI